MTSIHSDALRVAHERIQPYIHRTPVLRCASLDRITGAELFFKCENFQRVGAFKFRGATNAVFSLSESEASRGVVTHSSGNHGAALARAARNRGIPATVVMPETAPDVKRAAVEGYGANVRPCAPTLAAREQTTAQIIGETGATLIHPFNDERIISGQGTAALELLDEVPDLEAILAPIGGGGLLSGTCIAAKDRPKPVTVIGCEPAAVDDAFRSLASGKIEVVGDGYTIADGLRTNLGEITFAVLREHVDEIALASEEAIIEATWLLIERAKIVVEPSAAVPLAALLRGTIDWNWRGRKIGVILSGGNVDFRSLVAATPARDESSSASAP